MNDTAVGAGVIGAIAMLLITLGVWLGAAPYRHDTFDCTNKCGGAHSIELNQTCFCEVLP